MKSGLLRRLTRLEAAVPSADDHGHEHLISFLDPEKRVVSTLLLRAGHPLKWTCLAGSNPECSSEGGDFA